MSQLPTKTDQELDRLIDRMCDQVASVEELAALGRRLAEDPAARGHYIAALELHARLAWQMTPGQAFSAEELERYAEGSGGRGQGSGSGVRDSGLGVREPEFSAPSHAVGAAAELPCPLEAPSPEPLIPPIIIDTSPASLSSPAAFSFSIGGWLFSYAAATLITGVAILGAWAYKVSLDSELARERPRPAPRGEWTPEYVGRITGMTGCRWADPHDAPAAAVPLGRKYELVSGLVEIAYDSGATVILQGPCVYEVDSAAAGFLSLGKLTARVEKKDSGFRVQGSGAEPDPSSLIPHPSSLFSVRTPTAVVTDLGTEFGVEVDRSGRTQSQVFQGKVDILSVGGKGAERREMVLHAGQTARCGAGGKILVAAAAAGDTHYVRHMGPDLSGAERIVEKFTSDKLGPAFEQMPPGRYRLGHGVAEYRHEPLPANEAEQSRGYVRSVRTDFCDRDFVFEATFQVELRPSEKPTERHRVYLGIGDGVPNPNYFDEVGNGLVLDFVVDNGQASVELCRADAEFARAAADPDAANRSLAQVTPFRGLRPGRHCFRMWKTGKWVRFAVDADFQGEFHADFVSRPLDLPAVAPLLNSRNSRLLVGTGNCDAMTVRFEELSVAYTETANGPAAPPRPPQPMTPTDKPKGGARQ